MDLHINDISVTEKEGAAALAGVSPALYQMLQVGFNWASGAQSLTCFTKGKKLDPRNTPDKLTSVGLNLVPYVSTSLSPFNSSD